MNDLLDHGGRDRFRTCGLCRVKRVRAPHTALPRYALHHIAAAQSAGRLRRGDAVRG
jgi:hypothetical protein